MSHPNHSAISASTTTIKKATVLARLWGMSKRVNDGKATVVGHLVAQAYAEIFGDADPEKLLALSEMTAAKGDGDGHEPKKTVQNLE
jgi:hypothetical protein